MDNTTLTYIAVAGGTLFLVVLIVFIAIAKGRKAKRVQPTAGVEGHTMALTAFVPGQSIPPLSAPARPARPEDRTMQQSVVNVCAQCGTPMSPEWAHCASCGWTPPAKVPAAQLEIVKGPYAGRFLALDGVVTTIGSMDGNALVIAEPNVGRKAIGIRRSETGYELADLGTPSQVFINGQRMAKRILVAGDVVRIGSSEMVFRPSANAKVG